MSNDNVNHPSHYDGAGIECIDAMEVAFGLKGIVHISLGNAFKYNYRHRDKNGLEDLKKADFYLNLANVKLAQMEDDYDFSSLMEQYDALRKITYKNTRKWIDEHGEKEKE